MIIEVRSGLPVVTVVLSHRGQTVVVPDVILDTGSGGSLFRQQDVERIGLVIDHNTPSRWFRGVGGSERIWMWHVDQVFVDPLEVRDLEIGIGPVDYGFGIRGILGMDFLLQTGAVIDLAALELRLGRS
ncbi:MAG: clan AA aspartic protease [Desulfomonile tiedjei]|nr:clan AA aspartic protease [Desulfomonile tiedjei]